MNAILRISLEGQLQDVFEIEKILLAIFYKMWYIHYTKHCFERTLHRSMMYKWEVPAMTAVIYARYSTAVSYTHLDVYKRQGLDTLVVHTVNDDY